MEIKFSLRPLLAAGLSMFLTVAAPNAVFAGGGADAGGGSNTKPSFDEIREMATSLVHETEWARTTFNLQTWLYQLNDFQTDNRLSLRFGAATKTVMDKIRHNYLLHRSLTPQEIRFDFRTDGACDAIDGAQDAATQMCAPNGAPICLSLQGIRSHVPKANLRVALQALIMHEVAHQYCGDEIVAQKIEHLFSTGMAQKSALIEATGDAFSFAERDLRRILRQLDGSGGSVTDAFLCAQIGKYDGTVFELEHDLDLSGIDRHTELGKTMIDDKTWGALGLITGVFRLRGFCGGEDGLGTNDGRNVPAGDRQKLRPVIEQQIQLLRVAEAHFKEFIGWTIENAMNGKF